MKTREQTMGAVSHMREVTTAVLMMAYDVHETMQLGVAAGCNSIGDGWRT